MPYSLDNHYLSMEWRCREELVWQRRSLCLTEEISLFHSYPALSIQAVMRRQKGVWLQLHLLPWLLQVKLHSKHLKHPISFPMCHHQYCLPSSPGPSSSILSPSSPGPTPGPTPGHSSVFDLTAINLQSNLSSGDDLPEVNTAKSPMPVTVSSMYTIFTPSVFRRVC